MRSDANIFVIMILLIGTDICRERIREMEVPFFDYIWLYTKAVVNCVDMVSYMVSFPLAISIACDSGYKGVTFE